MSRQIPGPLPVACIAPAKLLPHIGAIVGDATRLLHADGELTPGKGMVTTVLALTLGFLSFMGVLAFLFP